jgi:uncharacterized protein YdaU (DUF1376 family)
MTGAPDNAPDPFVPQEIDLRDFPSMPVMIDRLRRSRAWLIAKRRPELGFYMLNLWMAAWHADTISLEDDDVVLADTAMCEPKVWERVRADVMRGWVRCSDGRLYHEVVCARALESWIAKLLQRRKSAGGNAKRWGIGKSVADIETSIRRAAVMLQRLDPKSPTLAKKLLQEPTGGPPPEPPPVPTGPHKDSPNDPTGNPTGIAHRSQGEGKVKGSISNTTQSSSTDGGSADDAVCVLAMKVQERMQALGVEGAHHGDPGLRVLIAEGADLPELEAAVAIAKAAQNLSFAYVLGIARKRRQQAAAAGSALSGPLQGEDAKAWHETRSGIIAKGEALGLGAWSEQYWADTGEQWPTYQARVFKAAGHSARGEAACS